MDRVCSRSDDREVSGWSSSHSPRSGASSHASLRKDVKHPSNNKHRKLYSGDTDRDSLHKAPSNSSVAPEYHQATTDSERLRFSKSVRKPESQVSVRGNAVGQSSDTLCPCLTPTKPEKKRKRDKLSKREKEAKRREREIKKPEEIFAEHSRNRSMFNGNKNTLPSIGQKHSEVYWCQNSFPKIEEKHDGNVNNVIDVINRNDANVRTTAKLKEISNDYIETVGKLIKQKKKHPNNAPEIIERNEVNVGKAYEGKLFYAYTDDYTARSMASRASNASSH